MDYKTIGACGPFLDVIHPSINSISFCRSWLAGRGSTLSRDTQTSLSPNTYPSSSGRFPRCSQANRVFYFIHADFQRMRWIFLSHSEDFLRELQAIWLETKAGSCLSTNAQTLATICNAAAGSYASYQAGHPITWCLLSQPACKMARYSRWSQHEWGQHRPV